jgi:peptidoglycan/LPS O-acetylase OafA/YrhL
MSVPKKLPGLNGLRAIAALFVLIGHVYQVAGFYGVKEATLTFDRYDIGKDMVNLFFVISGFIITYTLLHEKDRFKDINLRHFYIKRTLRIWPIYFLVMAIVFFITNYTHLYDVYSIGMYGQKHLFDANAIIILSFFVANFNIVFQQPVSILPHYWSLSVEEQFYIIWPFMFKYISPLKAAVFMLLATVCFKIFTDYMIYHSDNAQFWTKIWEVFRYSSYGSMAIGALGAIGAYKRKDRIQLLFHPLVQIIGWLLFAASILFNNQMPYIPYIRNEVMAIVYLVLILNVTLNKKVLISLENKVFDKIGTISYGMYMYHYPLLPLLIIALKSLGIWSYFTMFHQVPLVILTTLSTYFLAIISFTYFERPFLKLKPTNQSKFTVRAVNHVKTTTL